MNVLRDFPYSMSKPRLSKVEILKSIEESFFKISYRAKMHLGLIQIDLCELMQTHSISGSFKFLKLNDYFSKKIRYIFLNQISKR